MIRSLLAICALTYFATTSSAEHTEHADEHGIVHSGSLLMTKAKMAISAHALKEEVRRDNADALSTSAADTLRGYIALTSSQPVATYAISTMFLVCGLILLIYRDIPQMNVVREVSKPVTLLIYMNAFTQDLDFSLIMATVYDLVEHDMTGSLFTGATIGVYHVGAILGVVFSWLMDLEKVQFRKLFLYTLGFMPVGSVLYLSSALARRGSYLRYSLLVGSRCFGGVAFGIGNSVAMSELARISFPRFLSRTFVAYMCAEIAGGAAGPALSSVILQYVAPLMPYAHPAVVPTALVGALHLVKFCIGALYLPQPAAIELAEELAAPRDLYTPTSWRLVLASAMFSAATTCNYFVDVGLESATAFIFETEYGWSTAKSGYFTGIFLLVGVVLLKEGTAVTQTYFSGECSVLGLLTLSSVCSLLWLPQCWALLDGLWTRWYSMNKGIPVFLNQAITWPALPVANGMLTSFVFGLYSRQHANTVGGVLTMCECVAAALAPLASRYIIKSGGSSWYAHWQLCLVVLSLTLCAVAIALKRYPKAPN